MLIYLALGGSFVQLGSPSIQKRWAGVGQEARGDCGEKRNRGIQVCLCVLKAYSHDAKMLFRGQSGRNTANQPQLRM